MAIIFREHGILAVTAGAMSWFYLREINTLAVIVGVILWLLLKGCLETGDHWNSSTA